MIDAITKLFEVAQRDGTPKKLIPVAVEGRFFYDGVKEINWTRDRLKRYKENFDNNVYGQQIPFKVEHIEENPEGAAGWWKSCQLQEIEWKDGSKRLALLVEPEWNDYGLRLIENKRFKYISPEYYDQWMNKETGNTYEDVIRASSLTIMPHIKNQPEISLREIERSQAFTLPYPGEHAAKVEDPEKFEEFRRVQMKDGNEKPIGVDYIYGKPKGSDKWEIQSYRFDKKQFAPDEAKKWLKEHNITTTAFEPADSEATKASEVPPPDKQFTFEDLLKQFQSMSDQIKDHMKGKKGAPMTRAQMEMAKRILNEMHDLHFKSAENNNESEVQKMSDVVATEAIKLENSEAFKGLEIKLAEQQKAFELAEKVREQEKKDLITQLAELKTRNREMRIDEIMKSLTPEYVRAGEQTTVRDYLVKLGTRDEVTKLREGEKSVDSIGEFVEVVRKAFQPVKLKETQIGSSTVTSEAGAEKATKLSERVEKYAKENKLNYTDACMKMRKEGLITKEDEMD